MWNELSEQERQEYKKMILVFASLTEMFAQKADEDSPDESIVSLSPIINSKYQETVFQKVFKASAEDIGNTSYDASIERTDANGRLYRYFVGIKTFGYATGSQKVAQFKSNNDDWSAILNQIRKNSYDDNGNRLSKEEIDKKNNALYLELAENIAYLRNMRINSSEANMRGFDVSVNADNAQAVYHVLMPSKKGEKPYIYVGETGYDKINLSNIRILGCTSANNPANFDFTDGNHKYRYTAADSQLLMDFNNKKIVQDKWEVRYADDAYSIFSDIADKIYAQREERQVESYSWLITNKKGEVERYSGFNGFFGVSPKNKRTKEEIESKIASLRKKYGEVVGSKTLDNILGNLEVFLKYNTSTDDTRIKKEHMRSDIIRFTRAVANKEFTEDICKCVFRPANEMYIPLPNSRKFHEEHPNFFGENIGLLKKEGSKWKLVKEKSERLFTMVFEPSGDEMEMFIGQDAGKGIESNGKQSILGEWLLEKVFTLDKYEPLTTKKLKEIGINGIRLEKYPDDNRIHLHFIWIDEKHLPDDYIK